MRRLGFREDEQFAESHQNLKCVAKLAVKPRDLSLTLKSTFFSQCAHMHVFLFIKNRHTSSTFSNKILKTVCVGGGKEKEDELMFTMHLPRSRHCPKPFICIAYFNSHNHLQEPAAVKWEAGIQSSQALYLLGCSWRPNISLQLLEGC